MQVVAAYYTQIRTYTHSLWLYRIQRIDYIYYNITYLLYCIYSIYKCSFSFIIIISTNYRIARRRRIRSSSSSRSHSGPITDVNHVNLVVPVYIVSYPTETTLIYMKIHRYTHCTLYYIVVYNISSLYTHLYIYIYWRRDDKGDFSPFPFFANNDNLYSHTEEVCPSLINEIARDGYIYIIHV